MDIGTTKFQWKSGLEETKKFKIASVRTHIISNSPRSVHELLVLQYNTLKKMDYLHNSSEWTQLWTEVFALKDTLSTKLNND